VTDRTEEIAALLLRIEDPEIRSLFTPEFVLCCEEFDRFTTDMVLRLVRDLDLEGPLVAGTSAAEIARSKGFASRAEIPLGWFFRKLAAEGYVDRAESASGPVYRSRGPLPPGDPERAEARARAIDPRSVPPFTVVRAMVEHVGEFLRGEKT